MLSKPIQNDFCNYVESAGLLKMLFRCWKLSLWFCVKMLRITEYVWKVRASLKCFQNPDTLFLELCGKCGTPSNAFKMLRRTKFYVESVGLLKMLSKPMQNDFCNSVESAGLLKMLFRCWKLSLWFGVKILRITEFVWKVRASLKCFQNLDTLFLQLCGKCGTPSNAFKMFRRTEFVWKDWASLKCFQNPCKMIFAIMLKVRDS